MTGKQRDKTSGDRESKSLAAGRNLALGLCLVVYVVLERCLHVFFAEMYTCVHIENYVCAA